MFIRPVELLPGSTNDVIRTYISRASVEGALTSVCAKRYPFAEGDKSNLREIEVVWLRGVSHRSKPGKEGLDHATLDMTANLASALVHVRWQDTARCIVGRRPLPGPAEWYGKGVLELGKMGRIYAEAKNGDGLARGPGLTTP